MFYVLVYVFADVADAQDLIMYTFFVILNDYYCYYAYLLFNYILNQLISHLVYKMPEQQCLTTVKTTKILFIYLFMYYPLGLYGVNCDVA